MPWMAAGAAVGFSLFMLTQGVNLLPFLLLGGIAWFVLRNPALRSVTRRFAPVTAPAQVAKVAFEDIGGQETAKQELLEALDFLADAERTKKLGIRPLKGILLTGPPGTGKTLLAKAAATYTQSSFLSAAGSEFIEMYAGVGAQRVRELFQRAKELAREEGRQSAIIFIDEIEVLAARRGGYQGHLEYDQTINQLLVEMDGLKTDDDVRILVMAATNRADMLDEAILRPGRFDRVVKVDLPDRAARAEILRIHTRNKPLAPSVDLDQVARETFGFSGAHLESLCNEAAILAFRENAAAIEQRHFIEAIDKVILGEKLERRPSDAERRRVAIHETGHALVAELRRPGAVATVTISPRGGALGYVRQTPKDDRLIETEQELRDDIAVAMAGAAAEEICLDGRSTGAAGDYEQAFQAARKLVFAGMSRLGVVSPDTIPEETLHEVLAEIVQDIEREVRALITPYRAEILRVADILLEMERIDGPRLREIFRLDAA
jgi:cell division protease FtsH